MRECGIDSTDTDTIKFVVSEETVKLSALILDPSAQPRAQLNQETIEEYAEAMARGDRFPALQAFGTPKRAWLADGWHRYHAAQQNQMTDIDVECRPGGLDEAQWYALSSNAAHGLRRTNADKQRAVEGALKMRTELPDAEIARHCGVSQPMVGKTRRLLEASGVIRPTPVREVTRNGQTYGVAVPTAPRDRSGGRSRNSGDQGGSQSPRIGIPKPSSGRRTQPSFQNDSADNQETYRCADCGERVSDPHDCMNAATCNGQCPACCRSES